MAGPKPSTTRRRVLGAAAALSILAVVPTVVASAATQSSRSGPGALWNRRLARYQRLVTEAAQAAATGWFRAANDRYHREMAAIEALRAARPEQDETHIQRLRRAAFRRIDKAESAYWRRCTDPMQKAAVILVVTPAPDLAGLGIKLAVIRAHQLHEFNCMTRDAFEILAEDVRAFELALGNGQSP